MVLVLSRSASPLLLVVFLVDGRPSVAVAVLVMLVVVSLNVLWCCRTSVCHICQVSACVWLFLLWQPCCQCQGEFLLLMCLFRAKLLWRTVVPFLEVVWLLGVDTELFLQIHRLELCGPCSICGSSLCCRPRVLRTCWVSTLCVVPSMVLLGVCWWLFCRSFVVIVLSVFWFVPSVFDGIVRRCLVLVSCM